MRPVNLYLKTEYSLLNSNIKIHELMSVASEKGYQVIAMTDDQNMHGAIKFYQAAHKHHLKPIIGLNVRYQFNDQTSNLLLYALDNFGYQNLMKISSRMMINEGVVELEYLARTAQGVLVVTPSDENIIFDYIARNDLTSAVNHLNTLTSIYYDFYLGIAKQSEAEVKLFETIYQFGLQNKVKMVALHKSCYLRKEDLDVYLAVRAIDKNETIGEPVGKDLSLYLPSPDELVATFRDHLDLLEETITISEKCNVKIDFSEYQLPKYDESINADDYLKELCQVGLKKRLSGTNKDSKYYLERLFYELAVIKKMGFSDYFLIVWDFVKFAKKRGILVGPGRGSAPASLVSYCLGITDIDPIEYNLLFERFLNPERITMPDIDLDFPDDERDLVIQYVAEKYGKERVAHIVTFGTFALKLAIRDAARICNLSDVRFKEISRLLPSRVTSGLNEIIEKSEPLQRLMAEFEDIRKVLKIAMKLEGLPKNTSTHAAGIIITRYDLVNYTPVENGLNNVYQTQYEASDLEALGLLKIDFLGLRNLTNISKTIKLIKRDNPNFKMPDQFNDPLTFEMIRKGDTTGVFQLESPGMRKLLTNLRTNSFEDIIAAIALFRPGPMEMIPTFIKRKHKEEKVTYPHPDLEPILNPTYGTIVYQEQIMLIAWRFAGYSLGEADVLRRAVSKKNREILERERSKFVAHSIKRGYERAVAEEIYDYIIKFANYGFNKAHSVAYSVIAYQTAYLKARYFKYYVSVLLTSVIGSQKLTDDYYKEALSRKVKIFGPSINISTNEYTIENGAIFFPLQAINGLGGVLSNKILEERSKGMFKSFEDFIRRTCDFLPSSIIENLIYGGALDIFKLTKKAMINEYQNIIDTTKYQFVEGLLKPDYTTEEFDYGTCLMKEKEVLGINIKYNFFYQYAHRFPNKKLVKISDITKEGNVEMLLMIKSIRPHTTKKNEPMAFVEFTDDTGDLSGVLFPRVYLASSFMKVGMIALVYGKIEERNQRKQLVVEKLTTV
jgi:DNA polymerase-3 subunit alpha